MAENGNKDNLTERLRKKAETERLEIEEIMRSEYKLLASTLRGMSSDVVSSTKTSFLAETSSMKEELALTRKDLEQTKHMSKLLWLWSVSGLLVVSALTLVGLWMFTSWRLWELSDLKQKVDSERQALSLLEAKTGGVRLLRGPEEREQWYLILPNNTQAPEFKCNDKPCIKLGKE